MYLLMISWCFSSSDAVNPVAPPMWSLRRKGLLFAQLLCHMLSFLLLVGKTHFHVLWQHLCQNNMNYFFKYLPNTLNRKTFNCSISCIVFTAWQWPIKKAEKQDKHHEWGLKCDSKDFRLWTAMLFQCILKNWAYMSTGNSSATNSKKLSRVSHIVVVSATIQEEEKKKDKWPDPAR